MRKIWINLWWLWAVCACSSQPEVKCISFDLREEVHDIHQMGMFSGFQMIPLETRDSVLIGDIHNVVVWGDRVFVAEYFDTKAVYAFDLKGHFLGKVGRHGRGPEEYLQLSDLFVDPRTERLNLVSRIDQKLFEYDLEDFHVIRIRHLPKAFDQLLPWQEGYIGYMDNYGQDKENPYNLWVLDSNLQIVDWKIKIAEGWESTSTSMQTLSIYKDSLYYIEPTDFNVYRYADGKVEVAHRVDFGKDQIPEERISYDDLRAKYSWPQNYIVEIDAFQELPDYYLYQILHNGQVRLCLFQKHTGKRWICELPVYDKDYFVPFGEIISISSDAIITAVPASRMHEILKGGHEYVNYEEKYPEQIKRMREVLPEIAEDDNPCIVLWKFGGTGKEK